MIAFCKLVVFVTKRGISRLADLSCHVVMPGLVHFFISCRKCLTTTLTFSELFAGRETCLFCSKSSPSARRSPYRQTPTRYLLYAGVVQGVVWRRYSRCCMEAYLMYARRRYASLIRIFVSLFLFVFVGGFLCCFFLKSSSAIFSFFLSCYFLLRHDMYAYTRYVYRFVVASPGGEAACRASGRVHRRALVFLCYPCGPCYSRVFCYCFVGFGFVLFRFLSLVPSSFSFWRTYSCVTFFFVMTAPS